MQAEVRSHFSEWSHWLGQSLKPGITGLESRLINWPVNGTEENIDQLKSCTEKELQQLSHAVSQLVERSRQRPPFSSFAQSAMQHHIHGLFQQHQHHHQHQQEQQQNPRESDREPDAYSEALEERNQGIDDGQMKNPPSSPTLESLGLSKRSLQLLGQLKTPPAAKSRPAGNQATPSISGLNEFSDEEDPLATPVLATQQRLLGAGGTGGGTGAGASRHSFSSVESPNITNRFRFSPSLINRPPKQQNQPQHQSLLNHLEPPNAEEVQRTGCLANSGHQLSYELLCECIEEINEFFTECQLRGGATNRRIANHNSFTLRDLQEQAGLESLAAPVLTALLRLKRVGLVPFDPTASSADEQRRYRVI